MRALSWVVVAVLAAGVSQALFAQDACAQTIVSGTGHQIVRGGFSGFGGTNSSGSGDIMTAAGGLTFAGRTVNGLGNQIIGGLFGPVDFVSGEGEGEGGEGEGTAEGEGDGAVEGEGEGDGAVEGEGEGEGAAEGEGEGTAEGEGDGTVEGEGEGTEDPVHSGDWDGETGVISLSELLRIIQFFNSDGFHCDNAQEDNYAPGPGDTSCVPHSADWEVPANFRISLSELLRIIQFYNFGAYYACPDNPNSEDGFCPGTPGR